MPPSPTGPAVAPWPGQDDRRDDRPDEQGSAAVEMTLLVPAMIALLLLVVAAGRVTSARLTVQEAAHQAARTLTLARTPATAAALARDAALAVTTGKHLPCRDVDITVDVPPSATGAPDGAQNGGQVGPPGGIVVATVRLTCTVALADLTGLALPSTTTITATATSPFDRYKGSAA